MSDSVVHAFLNTTSNGLLFTTLVNLAKVGETALQLPEDPAEREESQRNYRVQESLTNCLGIGALFISFAGYTATFTLESDWALCSRVSFFTGLSVFGTAGALAFAQYHRTQAVNSTVIKTLAIGACFIQAAYMINYHLV